MLLIPYQAYFIFYFNVSNKLYILVQYDPVWINLNKLVWFNAWSTNFMLSAVYFHLLQTDCTVSFVLKWAWREVFSEATLRVRNQRVIFFDAMPYVPGFECFNELVRSFSWII